jgi:signal transduction histidine kinase
MPVSRQERDSLKEHSEGTSSHWPVILALGLVTALIVGMVGLDISFSQQEAVRTTDIIDNAQHSIILLNEIRFDAKRLAAANSPREEARWRELLLEKGSRYDPIAVYEGERREWNHLESLLAKLPLASTDQGPVQTLSDAIDKSVDALVAINAAAGRGNAAAIRAAHVRAIWSEVVAGGIMLAIVAIISVWLLRVLSRQRRLVLDEVQLLDQKNAELEAFASRAAHDLRSPMNPIRGYADLILESPSLPANVATMAHKIRRAVDRMARVVDDMLALSVSGRPPEGRSASGVVIPRVIEEMGAELQGVTVSTRLKAGQVACAEGVLAQILRNLIGNAIKFRSRARPLHIAIQTREVDMMVEFSVEDNGVGMDSESAKHAFEPFYRGPSDREIPGHGLGLAIVERTTRALGGTCELSSVPEQSTRIVIRLPRD